MSAFYLHSCKSVVSIRHCFFLKMETKFAQHAAEILPCLRNVSTNSVFPKVVCLFALKLFCVKIVAKKTQGSRSWNPDKVIAKLTSVTLRMCWFSSVVIQHKRTRWSIVKTCRKSQEFCLYRTYVGARVESALQFLSELLFQSATTRISYVFRGFTKIPKLSNHKSILTICLMKSVHLSHPAVKSTNCNIYEI